MSKDVLYLIAPGFEDPKHPGVSFVCPFCNQVEGLLASSPALATRLEIHRVGFLRPRQAVIDAVGEANQGLPLLVLSDEPPADAQRHGETFFIQDTGRILELLSERHGFPRLH